MLRCDECGGKGDIMGLGMIRHKCRKCSGTGWLLEDDEKLKEHGNPQLADHYEDTGITVVTVVDDEEAEDAQAKKKANRSEKMKASWAKRKAAKND